MTSFKRLRLGTLGIAKGQDVKAARWLRDALRNFAERALGLCLISSGLAQIGFLDETKNRASWPGFCSGMCLDVPDL